jgi:hypothetical protein
MVATLAELRSPVPFMGTGEGNTRLRSLAIQIEATVVRPLRRSGDELEWLRHFPAAADEWLMLRLQLVKEIERSVSDESIASATQPRLTVAAPEPARSAALYAQRMLDWFVARVSAMARHRRVDHGTVVDLVHDLAALELAIMSIIEDEDPPRPDVAEAAAWEAYARALKLRGLAFEIGLGDEDIPGETIEEKTLRARAMLQRVATGWSPDERAAVDSARFSRTETLP